MPSVETTPGSSTSGTKRTVTDMLMRPSFAPEHPLAATIFYNRQEKKGKKDDGFRVLRWGSLEHDMELRHGYIVPDGFLVQRHQSFILARHQITGYNGVEETHTDDGSSFKVRLSRGLHKGAKVQHEVLFKTSFDDTANRMLYAVKAGLSSRFESTDWQPTSTQAWDHFRERQGFEKAKSLSGPRLFGFQSDAVQAHLQALRAPRQQQETSDTNMVKTTKARGAEKRVLLKSVVKNLVADSKAAAAQSASSSSSRPQVLSDF